MKMIKTCLKYFLYTRLFYISLILFTYSFLLSKYDLSTDLLSLNETLNSSTQNFLEKILIKFLSYFSSYDAIHFIIIAKKQYINDNIFAFFPLFPTLISGMSKLFSLIFSINNEFIVYMLSGFLLSNLLCFLNCILLYSLVYKLINSELKSKICVILYLINPGTIFYISIYSENLCLTLQLIFIHYLIKSGEEKSRELNETTPYGHKGTPRKNFFLEIACLIIGLITTRSNTIALCTFFIIPTLILLFYKEKYILEFSDNDNHFFFNFSNFIKCLRRVFKEIGIYVVLCLHAILCFIYMTKFKPKMTICSYIKRNINKDKTKFNLFSNWCNHSQNSEINSFYNYIEKEYWNVGFLKQYSLNSIDRLILAFPMNICAIYILYKIYGYFDFKALLKNFDVRSFLMKENLFEEYTITKKEESTSSKEYLYKKNIILNSFILGGGLNFAVMFFVLVLIAHPQINNRLLSGCPIIYVFLCLDIKDFMDDNKNGNYWKGFLCLLFFICFSILSCVMQVGSYGFA